MILAAILMLAAFAVLLRLIFGLAVFALPILFGAAAGWLAHATGASWLGAAIVAFVAGTAALAAGQSLFALSGSPVGRMIVGLVYALPAAAIGYGVAYGFAATGASNPIWRILLALVGACVTGAAAFRSVAALAPPAQPGKVQAEAQVGMARDLASIHPR